MHSFLYGANWGLSRQTRPTISQSGSRTYALAKRQPLFSGIGTTDGSNHCSSAVQATWAWNSAWLPRSRPVDRAACQSHYRRRADPAFFRAWRGVPAFRHRSGTEAFSPVDPAPRDFRVGRSAGHRNRRGPDRPATGIRSHGLAGGFGNWLWPGAFIDSLCHADFGRTRGDCHATRTDCHSPSSCFRTSLSFRCWR